MHDMRFQEWVNAEHGPFPDTDAIDDFALSEERCEEIQAAFDDWCRKNAESDNKRPTTLYHVTTPKKAMRYRESGRIIAPVRGFTTMQAAMAWALRTRRTVVYAVPAPADATHKLPDHHNEFGEARWIDRDCPEFKCQFSAGRP